MSGPPGRDESADDEDRRGDGAEVLAANAALYAAVESADLDAMSALWADGPQGEGAVCVHPGWSPVRGRGPVLRSWAAIMAGTTYLQFVLTDVTVARFGRTAVVTLTENMLAAGRDTPRDEFAGGLAVATNVLVLDDQDRWRMVVHHASPVLTGGGAEPQGDEAAG